MSTASSFYDDTPPSDSLLQWKRIIHAEPRILEYQQSMLRRSVSHAFDMPYVAGYNTKGTRIYIDRNLPFIAKIDGKPYCIRDTIMLHEATEKALLALWEKNYEAAHHIATAVEYAEAKEMGLNLDSYRKYLRPFIKKDATEKLVRVPWDLDLTPMKGDASLIAKLKSLMLANKHSASGLFQSESNEAKVAKSSVLYRDHPSGEQQCSRCSMFRRPDRCSHVAGSISAKGWCTDFDLS